MSLELAIVSSLAVPALVLAYIGFELKDQHSSVKMLMVAVSQVFLLGLPFTGWQLALEADYPQIAEYMLAFELASIVVFTVFVFYMIWRYLVATSKALSVNTTGVDFDEVG